MFFASGRFCRFWRKRAIIPACSVHCPLGTTFRQFAYGLIIAFDFQSAIGRHLIPTKSCLRGSVP